MFVPNHFKTRAERLLADSIPDVVDTTPGTLIHTLINIAASETIRLTKVLEAVDIRPWNGNVNQPGEVVLAEYGGEGNWDQALSIPEDGFTLSDLNITLTVPSEVSQIAYDNEQGWLFEQDDYIQTADGVVLENDTSKLIPYKATPLFLTKSKLENTNISTVVKGARILITERGSYTYEINFTALETIPEPGILDTSVLPFYDSPGYFLPTDSQTPISLNIINGVVNVTSSGVFYYNAKSIRFATPNMEFIDISEELNRSTDILTSEHISAIETTSYALLPGMGGPYTLTSHSVGLFKSPQPIKSVLYLSDHEILCLVANVIYVVSHAVGPYIKSFVPVELRCLCYLPDERIGALGTDNKLYELRPRYVPFSNKTVLQ